MDEIIPGSMIPAIFLQSSLLRKKPTHYIPGPPLVVPAQLLAHHPAAREPSPHLSLAEAPGTPSGRPLLVAAAPGTLPGGLADSGSSRRLWSPGFLREPSIRRHFWIFGPPFGVVSGHFDRVPPCEFRSETFLRGLGTSSESFIRGGTWP